MGTLIIVNVVALVVVVGGGTLVGVGWALCWPLWRPVRVLFDRLARLFPRPVTPARLQRRIMRQAVDRIAIGVNGAVLAPTVLDVRLSAEDVEVVGGVGDWLAAEIAGAFTDAVVERGGSYRPARVGVVVDDTRPVGRPLVEVRFEEATVHIGHWDPDAPTRKAPGTTERLPGWSLVPTAWADGAVVELDGGDVVVGRSRDADARVADASVSALHAALRESGGWWSVTDLGSTNGTFVNGAQVADTPVPLAEGDQLRIGTSTWRVARR